MKLTDDIVYNQVRRNFLGINTFKFLFVPLLLYAFCLTIAMFDVSLCEWVSVLIAFIYVFYLSALHKEFIDIRVSLIGEFEKYVRDDINFVKSPTLPKNPYLTDGYIYAVEKNYEFSKPFALSYTVTKIVLNGKTYTYEGGNLDDFKLETLKDFERSGKGIVAIRNKYGQYIWIKGDDFNHGKLYRFYKLFQIYLLRILLFVGLLVPLIWLLRPIWLNEINVE